MCEDNKKTHKWGSGNIQLSSARGEPEKIGLQSFLPIMLLGKGSFGEVYLVQKKSNGQMYAMKSLSKRRIFSHNLAKYAYTEKNIQSSLSHPFIVKLHFSFQTAAKLFLVMDYCPGGDLGHALQKAGTFPPELARAYLCEVLLAIEELHNREIIYRDLKPDNLVLDADGHAMLTDFGLSKEGVKESDFTMSFCGSVAYLAPEVLCKTGHGRSVDWYLLGVLLYEMLVGKPPYFNKSK
jgi:serine/threonine protein kinase